MAPTHFHTPDPSLRRAVVFCVLTASLVPLLVVFGPAGTEVPHRATWAALTDVSTARATLDALASVRTSPEIAYDRTRDFGPAWSDVDHNGCDTRNDILRRDLVDVVLVADSDGCVVERGRMIEPYTGAPVTFSRSQAAAVQIDHLIPLHAAWILGAWEWTPARRLSFANDPRNLVAVDGEANRTKSDSLADRWRPPDGSVHCVYALNTVFVHAEYALGVTQPEREALEAMLGRCP